MAQLWPAELRIHVREPLDASRQHEPHPSGTVLRYEGGMTTIATSGPSTRLHEGETPAARTERLLETIRRSVIGKDRVLVTPFGNKPLVYSDYTASGRPLAIIEDLLRDLVLPTYANTHTETSATGRQTTAFREEARSIIHRAAGGKDDDVVIFCGSGATAAIVKVVQALGLQAPADSLRERIAEDERPVVFIGPYEHHSNELPWRESIADVVTILETADGHVDLEHLEEELERYASRPLKIGSFSAASNVTGIRSDTAAIATMLHKHGALSFWDYAAAGPYTEIDMNPPGDGEGLAYKDAVFLSSHKFIGGPGTPGILIVKKHVLKNRVPTVPGGGTVNWVSPEGHSYVEDRIHREEGGTPDIIGSIRAGLVFRLKDMVGVEAIDARERSYIKRAIASWSQNPNLRILGDQEADRLSIVAFVVHHRERCLHHNFVVALLNDLFGIQARGGCSCAGPYGHRLLGIDNATSMRLVRAMEAGCPLVKPGWTRVGFNYFITEDEFDYIIRAVHAVADHGYKLLPMYACDPDRDEWRFTGKRALPDPPLLRLVDLDLEGRRPREVSTHSDAFGYDLGRSFEEAMNVLEDAGKNLPSMDAREVSIPEAVQPLRWFWLPQDIVAYAHGREPVHPAPDFLNAPCKKPA